MHVVIRLGSRSLILFFGLLSTSAQHDNCPPCRSGSDVTLTRAMAGQPLGLRLSQELEILEFHPTDAGLPRAIEASGRTALGDQLVAVNGESIDLANNMSFQQAIALLQQATFPKTLSFRRGPRELDFCPDEEFEEDELEEKEPELGQDGHGLIIIPDPKHTMEDGPSPRLQHLRGMLIGRHNTSVETEHCHRFRPLISAEPALACSSITSRVQNGLVVVFNSGGCPLYVKALHVQEAGGAGVIVVGRKGQPLPVNDDDDDVTASSIDMTLSSSPRQTQVRLTIPIFLVSYYAGEVLRALMMIKDSSSSSSRYRIQPTVQLAFSPACLKTLGFNVVPSENDADDDNSEEDMLVLGGILQLYSRGRDRLSRLEFLQATAFSQSSFRTTFVAKNVRRLKVFRPEEDVCGYFSRSTSRQLREEIAQALVVVTNVVQQNCTTSTTIHAHVQDKGGAGIVWVNLTSPVLRSSDQQSFTSLEEKKAVHIPVLVISSTSYAQVLLTTTPADNSLQVEMIPHHAVVQHWKELQHLTQVSNWPPSVAGRRRLFHRIQKSHHHHHHQSSEMILESGVDEKYNRLVQSYWQAQVYYNNHQS